MTTAERLEQFYPFDEAVLGAVADAAAYQDLHTFRELADRYGVSGGPQVVPAAEGHKAFEVLTLQPRQDYDATEARLLHLPMAMPINPAMTMRAFRLFEADPARQLIVHGNPSAAGERYGKLRAQDLPRVFRKRDLTPAIDPFLGYLQRRGVGRTEELGFSYGADASAVSSARSADHDILVEQAVWAESAAALWRGPGILGAVKLAIDFMSAGNELDKYIAHLESEPLTEAHQLSDVGLPRYLLGLARASNLAIGNALGHADFEARARRALDAQPDMRATLAWGTASELTDHDTMVRLSRRLRLEFGEARVGSLAMQGMHHAGGDDIDLHAAIMLQGLRGADDSLPS